MVGKTLTDQEVLEAIKDGREDVALEHLYVTLLPEVKKITKSFKTKELDAYDIFQESILKFYDYVKRGKFNPKHAIGAFVLTVAKNRLIDLTRKKRNQMEVSFDDSFIHLEDDTHFDGVVLKEKKTILEKIFELVGERCKELLLLSVFDRRSMTEISEQLNFSSENSAKTQNYKCKQRLIKALEQNPELAKQVDLYV